MKFFKFKNRYMREREKDPLILPSTVLEGVKKGRKIGTQSNVQQAREEGFFSLQDGTKKGKVRSFFSQFIINSCCGRWV